MSLRERIQNDITTAVRSGDTLRRDTLRMAWNAIYAVEKRDRHELSDADVVTVIAREVKTRRESVEAFRAGGREELAAKEESEIAILTGYLPPALTEDELQSLVDEALDATSASSAREIGKVMGWLAPRTRGRADGKRVSELVAQALARRELSAHGDRHGEGNQ